MYFFQKDDIMLHFTQKFLFCFFQQGTMLDVINSTNKKTMAEIALMSDSNEVKIWQYWIHFFSTYTELIVWNTNLCQFGHLIRICDKGSNSLFWILLIILIIEKFFKIPSIQFHPSIIYCSLFYHCFFLPSKSTKSQK